MEAIKVALHFLGVNENGYGPPKGFCFDTYCGDQPIMDDPNLEDNNVDEKVKFFIDAAHHQVIIVWCYIGDKY